MRCRAALALAACRGAPVGWCDHRRPRRRCNATACWADGVCGSADSVWRPLSGDFSNATLRGRVEIVVSHCSVPLAWLDGDIAALAARGVDVTRVSVYSKCGGGGDVGLKFEPAVVYDYDNVGRCDHSYAVHLAEAYDSLEDMTLFTKDSFRSQPRRRRRELADVVAGAAAHGFGCGVGSEASDWYDGPTLRAWTIPKYRKAWDQNHRRLGHLGRTREIQRRFNVSVPRARVTRKASTRRGRSER